MFDVRSMFLVAALTAFTCMIVLWSMRRAHAPSRNGLTIAAVAEGLMAVSLAMIAIRGLIPDSLSIFLANTIGTVGGLLIYLAARRILHASPLTGLILAASVIATALHSYWGSDQAYHMERIVLTSLVQGGTSAALIPLMMSRRGKDAITPLRWGIAFALVYSAMHFVRIAVTLNTGVQVQSGGMVSGNFMIDLMAALFSVAPMIYAMVLIGLVNGRLAYEYRRLASIDSLTGLNLRRTFFDQSNRELGVPRESGQAPVVMMFDLDHFKRINDTLGHAAGDAVLVDFAQTLRQNTPKHAVLGRYGGEEFCLMLPSTTPREALQVAEHICERTHDISAGDGSKDLPVSVSIGLASYPDDGQSVGELMMAADRRVYLAKSAGRDRVFAADRRPDAIRPDGKPGYVVNEMLPV